MAKVSKADMMMARDAVARAFNAMKAAEMDWNSNPCEATNARSASARKEWVKSVKCREAMERRMWAQEDAA